MNPKTTRSLVIGLCSIGGIVAATGVAVAALLAYTKKVLSNLDFDESTDAN